MAATSPYSVQAFNKGSTVTIHLTEFTEADVQPEAQTGPAETHQGSAFKILVVDDNIDAAGNAGNAFRNVGA